MTTPAQHQEPLVQFGSPDPDELNRPAVTCDEQAAELRAVIEKGLAVAEMVRTPGWTHLQQDLEQRRGTMMLLLLHETELDKIRMLQADINAANYLLNYAAGVLVEMEDARRHTNGKGTGT
jgi:hypothetical protein